MDGDGRQTKDDPTGVGAVLDRVRDEFGILSTEATNIRTDIQDLASKEVQLLKAEAAEQLRVVSRVAIYGVSGGLLGFLALSFLAVTTFAVLDSFMDAALAALMTAVILAALAGIALLLARSAIKQLSFTPRRTINSLREDAEWLGTLTRSNKR